MTRFISHKDMTGADIARCGYQVEALIRLCECAAWTMENAVEANDGTLPDAIGQGLRLAIELLEPVHGALALHERSKDGTLEADKGDTE